MNKNNYVSLRNRSVVKANELIQNKSFSLTVRQQKIVLFLISQINPEDEDFKLYDFDIRTFCKVCGIDYDNGKNYIELWNEIKKIRDKSINGIVDGKLTTLSWIEKPYLIPRTGTIQIRIDRDMKPYLLQLKSNFTRYELVYTLYFRSKYSIRLYELIKSIHYHDLETYERVYTIEELKKLLDAETHKTYQHFNDKVMKIATREINEHSDKIIEYEPLRNGRSYDRIKLTIRTKNSDDIAEIRADIDRRMNFNADQYSLFDSDDMPE